MIERLSHRYIVRTHTLTLYLTQFLHTFDVRLTYTICLLFFPFSCFFRFFRFSCFRHCCCFYSLFQCSCFNAYDRITLTVNFDYLILFFRFSCQLHFSFTLWLFTLHDFSCCEIFLFFCKIPFQLYLKKVSITNGATMSNRVFAHSIWRKATSIYSNNSQQNEFMLNFIFKLFKFVLTKTTTHGRG